MKQTFLHLVIFFVLLFGQVGIISAQTTNKLLERAKTSIEKKEYDQATKDLTAIIALEPNNAEAYAQRSRVYFLLNDLKNALVDAENAIKLNNKSVIALNIRGLVKVSQKDTDSALADFTNAINFDPNYAKAYINRARIMRSRKEFDKAIADYTLAIKADPKSGFAYLSRGNIYFYDKVDYTNAIADFSKAIDLDSKDKEAYVRRADAYLHSKDYQRSLSDANKALKIAPDFASAYFARGLVLAYQPKPDYPASIADFTKAIELKDTNLMAEAYRNRAYLHNLFDKDYVAAMSDATEAIKLNPNTTNSYEERGFAETQLKKFADAEKDYRQATKMNPSNAYNFAMLGFINDNLGNGEQAIADFQQALALDPNNETSKKNLALLLSKYPSDKYAARLKIISEPFKQLFDPTTETSHELIKLKTDHANSDPNSQFIYIGSYSFLQPVNRLFNIQLALTGISGDTMGYDLYDQSELVSPKFKDDVYSKSNIQYIIRRPLNHKFNFVVGSSRQNVSAEIELATMDVKYLKYDSRWDIFNQIMFFFGNSVAYNVHFPEIMDENGVLLSKNPKAHYLGAESHYLEWNLMKLNSREEAIQARDIIFGILKNKLDASRYEITKQGDAPNGTEMIKIFGLPRMGFLMIQVKQNELVMITG